MKIMWGIPLIIRLQNCTTPRWSHRTFSTFPNHNPISIPTQKLPWERDSSSQTPRMTLLVTAKLLLTEGELSGTKTNITRKKASVVSFRGFFTWKIISAVDETLKEPLLEHKECSPSCYKLTGPWLNSCLPWRGNSYLHTLESQKPSHERQATSEVTLKHNLPKLGSKSFSVYTESVDRIVTGQPGTAHPLRKRKSMTNENWSQLCHGVSQHHHPS